MLQVDQTPQFTPRTNATTEEKVRTPCTALPPGWTKEIVLRRSGVSAGKSDVYYYSPTGKKLRSKPELVQYLLQTSGEVIDLRNFDFRSGTFVAEASKKPAKKRKQGGRPDVYSKDLVGVSMAYTSVPSRQSKKASKQPVTVVSKDTSGDSLKDLPLHKNLDHSSQRQEDVVSPRQIFWEKRLQSMTCCNNNLEDTDIFSSTNGEFHSLLHSIVKTLQMERDLANKMRPLGAVVHSSMNYEQPTRALIQITKEDILKQERKVVKARKELAKAITEYEAAKSL